MKTEYHHIPPEIIREVADVFTEGAHKVDTSSGKTYTSRGWRLMHKEDPEGTKAIYSDALSRHLLARACGEVLDPDSGKPHLVRALANIIILRDLERLDMEYHAAHDAVCCTRCALGTAWTPGLCDDCKAETVDAEQDNTSPRREHVDDYREYPPNRFGPEDEIRF